MWRRVMGPNDTASLRYVTLQMATALPEELMREYL
jgi:hypothetical protein